MTTRPRAQKRRTMPAPSGQAIGYRRVSTDEQRESGLGLDAQAAAIATAATRHQITLRDTFTDAGLSGALPMEERPELMAALAALRPGDVLIVAKRDRLARDVMHAAMIEAKARDIGARILSAAGEGTESDEPTAQLMRTMIDAFAAYERLLIGVRTTAALRVKKARGERVSRHAPYGFRFTDDTPTRLEPEANEQAILAIMQECRAADFTLEGTARELNRLGLRTRAGTEWRQQYIRNALIRSGPGGQSANTTR